MWCVMSDDEDLPFREIGFRLMAIRESYEMDGTQFPESAGIPSGSYNHWERGRHNISVKNAIKIAERYDVSLDYIYRGKYGILSDERRKLIQEAERGIRKSS